MGQSRGAEHPRARSQLGHGDGGAERGWVGDPRGVTAGPSGREVLQIDQFLKETAAREANAKVRLQHFIEELLDRADRAEKQLQIISSSCGTTPNGSLGRCGTPATKAIARAGPLRAQARPRLRECARDFGNAARGFRNSPSASAICPGLRERARGFGNAPAASLMEAWLQECGPGSLWGRGGWCRDPVSFPREVASPGWGIPQSSRFPAGRWSRGDAGDAVLHPAGGGCLPQTQLAPVG